MGYENTSEAVEDADMVPEKASYASERNKTTHAVELTLCIIQGMMDSPNPEGWFRVIRETEPIRPHMPNLSVRIYRAMIHLGRWWLSWRH